MRISALIRSALTPLRLRPPKRRLPPLARVVGGAVFSGDPEWFTVAPIGAVRKLLDKVGWTVARTDLFEINEAFAAVTMAAERELERAVRDARLGPIGGGTDEIMKEILGRSLGL